MTQERRFEPAPLPTPGELSDLVTENPAALKALFDGVPANVLVLDGEENLIFANREFYRFTGLPVGSVIGAHIGHIIGSEGYHFYDSVRERVYGGESVSWEGWIDLPHMGRHYFRESVVPYGPIGVAPRTFVVMSLDLTPLKLRERELNEKITALETSESLKAAIVDHALAALISTDASGVIVDFNPAAEKMFGCMRASAMGRMIDEFALPERHRVSDNTQRRTLLESWEAQARTNLVEIEALRADHTEFPAEMALWRTVVGETVHFTISLSDLSERRAFAFQLQQERERLRQSEKLSAMGTLLAGVAHELNNPLAIVMGRASLLAEKYADQPALMADAQLIREAAERCGRIVRTFLNMARSRPAVYTKTSLNHIARAAIEMLAYTYRTSSVECRLTLDPTLPVVEADGDQIGQVILNLLVNAQQALLQHTGERRISMSTGTADGLVWLRLADNGPGVPDAVLEKIFDPYFTTKAEGVGTGLGLSVSRSIMKDHGGDLLLESHPSEPGASFLLRLPMRASTTTESPARAIPSVRGRGLRARVLVVDDEPELVNMMCSVLESAGYEVATAGSGAAALKLLDANPFDMIVTDLHMPEMDGAGLWRAVRSRDVKLAERMLFVTGDTLSPGASAFLSEQGGLVLDKPFTLQDLRDRVETLLAMRG